jgi:hypothetical protein
MVSPAATNRTANRRSWRRLCMEVRRQPGVALRSRPARRLRHTAANDLFHLRGLVPARLMTSVWTDQDMRRMQSARRPLRLPMGVRTASTLEFGHGLTPHWSLVAGDNGIIGDSSARSTSPWCHPGRPIGRALRDRGAAGRRMAVKAQSKRTALGPSELRRRDRRLAAESAARRNGVADDCVLVERRPGGGQSNNGASAITASILAIASSV